MTVAVGAGGGVEVDELLARGADSLVPVARLGCEHRRIATAQHGEERHGHALGIGNGRLGSMSEQVMATLQGATLAQPGARIRQVVRAVTGAYGGRSRVHRLLMEHALTQGAGGRTSPLLQGLTQLFTTQGVSVPGLPPRRLTLAQAFTLTHAIGGVLRALAASAEPPPVQEVEDAVVQMALAFLAALPAG